MVERPQGQAFGVRSSTYNGYQWDEVMSAMSDVFLCGPARLSTWISTMFSSRRKKPMRRIRTSKLTAISLALSQ